VNAENGAASVPESGEAIRLAQHMNRSLLTPEQVAEMLAVPVTWVRAEARAGRLPSVRLGHYRRFVQADVDAWIEQLRGRR
jgi:excisionase family DNA binding protein